MARFFHKFKIILWKNLLIRKFHWIITLLELCIPVILFLAIVSLNSSMTRQGKLVNEMVYPPEEEAKMYRFVSFDSHICYTPVDNTTTELISGVKKKLAPEIVFEGVNNETEVENAYKEFKKNNTTGSFFAILFSDNIKKFPVKKLEYTIRSEFEYRTSAIFSGLTDAGTSYTYSVTGFLGLQIALDKSFMELKGKGVDVNFDIQSFPTPAITSNDARDLVIELLKSCTVMSFIFLCPAVLKRVVEEKSTGVKELMKLMGVPSLAIWLGWFIHAIVISAIAVTVISILLVIPFKQGMPVMLSNPFVIWVFLMLYCTASIFFLFAIAVFFKRPTIAMVCGIVLWLGSYVVSIFLSRASSVRFCCKILSSLLPNIALIWGYGAFYHYEHREIGMSLGSIVNPSVSTPNDLQMWHVWLMFAIDSALYFAIALYIEAVFPGEYGVGKSWYFPLTDFMNFVGRIAPHVESKVGDDSDKESFEPLANSLPVGIRIRGLRKAYQSAWSRETKVAVDGVSLDICKEQITALLGHNGAGKTTTMMVLTGMLPPTEGTVEIHGYDIKYHLNKVRESLGLCPQHNLLFPDLTVKEHLQFFAWMRSDSRKTAETEVDLFMTKLKLHPHVNKKPHELSGGFKRRLCLGIAFMGQPKTVILDEPTSGLDPEARREIWDLLLNMREGRTILITTHIMEEADVLGDRIAIMDHGRVQCYGTPMFLKKLYGTGYVLSIMKKSSAPEEAITAAVRGMIPEAELKSCVVSLMTFRLPDEKRGSFPQLFALLQREREPLGIECVGVSITTLEEVFLRVGEIALEEAGKIEDCISETSEKSECSAHALEPQNIKGLALLRQRVEALLEKQLLVMGLGHLIRALLVISVFILVTRLSVQVFGRSPPTALNLNLALYGETKVLYERSNAISENIIASYVNTIKRAGSTPEEVAPGMNITDAILKMMTENPELAMNYIVAAILKNPHNVTAMYYDVALHSLPISINLLTNAWLRHQLSDDSYSISVSNHPYPTETEYYLESVLVTFMWMAAIPLVLTFWMGLFIRLPLLERVTASRQQQRMAGVWVPLHWFSLYIWDMLLHIILILLIIGVVYFVDTLGVFTGSQEISMLFLLLLLYGISAIPFSYFVSFWRDTQASTFACLLIINILGGPILMIVLEILQTFDSWSVYKGIQAVCRLLPNFALSQGLYYFVSEVLEKHKCLRTTPLQLIHECKKAFSPCCHCKGESCYDPDFSYFKNDKSVLLALGLSYLLYLALAILLDLGTISWLWEKIIAVVTSFLGSSKTDEPVKDEDVEAETQNVQDVVDSCVPGCGSDMLVNNLKKKYGLLPKSLAVKGVSFQVKPGECFGLLGVNGAGKTSTFKMLTGAVYPTSGTASVAGYRLDREKSQFLAQIGYCPQQDALIECLSANKLLRLYGALRGIPRSKLDAEVEKWVNVMGLREYRDKSCGTYSGGNKRKLSTALALIGSPPLVFLDEPTSGVDPVARRNLWNVLISLQKAGQSIVLTSHSMEECEALCNRLGIMVAGQLVCVGSIPYLKNKFKQGSTVKIKLTAGSRPEVRENLKKKVEETFFGCILKDEHETLLHYQVTDKNVSWGILFEKLENLKKSHDAVEDYTISETTLEEVFLSFAQG